MPSLAEDIEQLHPITSNQPACIVLRGTVGGWNSYCLRTASIGMLRTMETVCIAVSGGSEPLGA